MLAKELFYYLAVQAKLHRKLDELDAKTKLVTELVNPIDSSEDLTSISFLEEPEV
jgi:hypothetical protein